MAFNCAWLNKIKELEIIPIMEEEYVFKDKYMTILSKVIPLCDALEKANIKLKNNELRVKELCKKPRALKYLEELTIEQSDWVYRLYDIANTDKIVGDIEVDDLEQIVYVINKTCYLANERVKICLQEIDKQLNEQKQNDK